MRLSNHLGFLLVLLVLCCSFVPADGCPCSQYQFLSICASCKAGTWSDGTTSYCTDVDAGYYDNGGADGATRGCTSQGMGACSAGFFCPSGSTDPAANNCSAGYYCPVGSATEQGAGPCESGYYCPAGSSSPTQQPCGISNYCPSPSTPPIPVQPGSYSNGTSNITRTSIQYCTPGTYCTGDGEIRHCAPGTVSGCAASICHQCEAGSYSDSSASNCLLCPAGTYSQPAATDCTTCPEGHISNLGSSVCTPCTSGTYALGSSVCSRCASGFTSNDGITCSQCPANTVSRFSEPCLPCDKGTFTLNNIDCNSCPPDTYQAIDSLGTCISCIGVAGLLCPGGAASVSEGYWAYLEYNAAGNYTAFRTAECDACPQRRLQASLGNNSSSTPMAGDAASITGYCDWPRVDSASNTLCGACVSDYVLWNGQCVSCPSVNVGAVVLGLILSFALVLFLLRTAIPDRRASGVLNVLLYFLQIAALMLGNSGHILEWLRFSSLGTRSSTSACIAPWNEQQQTLAEILSLPIMLLQLGFIAAIHLTCVERGLSRPAQRKDPQHSISEIPLAVISSGTSARIHAATNSEDAQGLPSSKKHDTHPPPSSRSTGLTLPPFESDRYVAAVISLMLFSYTRITTTCLSYSSCVTVGSEYVLREAPYVDCRSSAYRDYLPIVYLTLVCYSLGFPLILLLWLMHNRKQVWKDMKEYDDGAITAGDSEISADRIKVVAPIESNNGASAEHRDSGDNKALEMGAASDSITMSAQATSLPASGSSCIGSMYARFGILYCMYRVNANDAISACLWPSAVLLRRAVLILVAVFATDVRIRFLCFGIMHWCSLLLHIMLRPFTSQTVHVAELAVHALLTLLAIILGALPAPFPVSQQIVLCFLLGLPAVALMCVIAADLLQRHLRPVLQRVAKVIRS